MTLKSSIDKNYYFEGLFGNCQNSCQVYTLCGGDETAPCGCIWQEGDPNRYACAVCPLICKERKETNPAFRSYDYNKHILSGKLLSQVTISQSTITDLPLFIPTLTHVYKGGNLPLEWAAVDLKTLFKKRGLRKFFNSEAEARDYLHVDDQCKLIAVLNSKDVFLEDLWGLGEDVRTEAFKWLADLGFSIGTGATFSVSSYTYLKGSVVRTPNAHNIAMLSRHHRTIDELQASGLLTVPNLYWRDNNPFELAQWKVWLLRNSSVNIVSRDFTSTRDKTNVLAKVNELVSLLNQVGRKFHVLIIGTGAVIGPMVLEKLLQNNHSGSIITSSPIFDAIKSARKYSFESGVLRRVEDKITPPPALILNNLANFEAQLKSKL